MSPGALVLSIGRLSGGIKGPTMNYRDGLPDNDELPRSSRLAAGVADGTLSPGE
jgi:hypothetical protein